MKFHHIGIATNNIEKTKEKINSFFEVENISQIVYDSNQDANLCMVSLKDGIQIELVSGKVVENFLKKRQYLYHTCYEVENIDETISKILSGGGYLVKEPKRAILFENRKVAFLMWDLGLIELLERR